MRHGHIKAGNPPTDSLSESPCMRYRLLLCPIGKPDWRKRKRNCMRQRTKRRAADGGMSSGSAVSCGRKEKRLVRHATMICIAIWQLVMHSDNGRRSPTEVFTFDPSTTGGESQLTPDYRRGGAGTLTAHRMALVYWPMLKTEIPT